MHSPASGRRHALTWPACLLAAFLAGCSADPKAPQVDIGEALGFAPPPEIRLTPAPSRPLPALAELERHLAGLGDEDPSTRSASEDGLVALGETALPRLDAMSSSPDAEVAARAASAAKRIRLGEALWLADLIESNWSRDAEGSGSSGDGIEGLLETLRRPLGPTVEDPPAYRKLLDRLFFAERFMTDPAREARIDEVLEAHPAIQDQFAALAAEAERDPEFLDKRHRRAVAEIVRVHILGLRSGHHDTFYDALRPCGSWRGTQALLVLPTLGDLARHHADRQARDYVRGYLLGMLAEGTDFQWGAPPVAWPGPAPHRSSLAPAAKDLVPFMMEVASAGDTAERAWALRAVGHIGDPSIVPALLRSFREDRPVRAEALRALVTLGAPEAREAILEAVGSPGDPALVPALHACAHLRLEEAHDRIAAIFDAPSGEAAGKAASVALCALARPEDLARLARIVDGWSVKTGALEMTPGFSAILRLRPGDGEERRRIAARCEALLKAESGSVRLAAAWILESFDSRAGVRAFASLLDDFTFTEGALRLPISWTAIGALERLTGAAFRGGEGVQTKEWKEWWAQHHGEYEDR